MKLYLHRETQIEGILNGRIGERMAYSKDFREQALVHCQNGLSDDQVCNKLGVSKQTLGNWKKLLFATGSLDKKKTKRKSGTPYKYTPNKIAELLGKSQTLDTSASSKDFRIAFQKSKKKKKKYQIF